MELDFAGVCEVQAELADRIVAALRHGARAADM
jgi:hypothetical protein